MLKIILHRHVTDILQCSSPETGHKMAVINFKRFSVAVYCIVVIYQAKVTNASYETGVYILNLAVRFCGDVLKVPKAFHSWPFLTKWHIDS